MGSFDDGYSNGYADGFDDGSVGTGELIETLDFAWVCFLCVVSALIGCFAGMGLVYLF